MRRKTYTTLTTYYLHEQDKISKDDMESTWILTYASDYRSNTYIH